MINFTVARTFYQPWQAPETRFVTEANTWKKYQWQANGECSVCTLRLWSQCSYFVRQQSHCISCAFHIKCLTLWDLYTLVHCVIHVIDLGIVLSLFQNNNISRRAQNLMWNAVYFDNLFITQAHRKDNLTLNTHCIWCTLVNCQHKMMSCKGPKK